MCYSIRACVGQVVLLNYKGPLLERRAIVLFMADIWYN